MPEEEITLLVPACPYCEERIGPADGDLTAEEVIFKRDIRNHLFRHLNELRERIEQLEENKK